MTNAKRRITSIDFSKEGAHVALVSKTINGGPANQYDVLLTKGMQDISEDVLQKAAEVRVELSFVDFLRKFFDMYYSEAEALARFLGYEISDEDVTPMTHEQYIDSQIENMTLLKSANKSADLNVFLKELGAEETVQLLEVQSKLEKAFGEQPNVLEDNPDNNQLEENSDMHDIEEIMKSAEGQAFLAAELEKAKDEGRAEIQTQLDEAVADLEKALNTIDEHEKQKAEAEAALRKSRLSEVVGEDEVEELFKSIGGLEDEAFETVLKSFESKTKAMDESDLTKEVGVGGEGTADEDSATAEYLRNKYQNK